MNNSLQLLMVLKYIMEKSSESNPITNADIIEFLKCNKLNPCKKTMISIIKSIKDAGFDLITVKDKRTNMYYIPSEHFDTTEARLLIDSVISAKFVTPKKAEILLEKLVGLSDRDMLLQYMKEQRNDGDIVGAGTITAEVVVEREFGNGSFLEMYSGYVSKKIIELLELEKENNAEDSSE